MALPVGGGGAAAAAVRLADERSSAVVITPMSEEALAALMEDIRARYPTFSLDQLIACFNDAIDQKREPVLALLLEKSMADGQIQEILRYAMITGSSSVSCYLLQNMGLSEEGLGEALFTFAVATRDMLPMHEHNKTSLEYMGLSNRIFAVCEEFLVQDRVKPVAADKISNAFNVLASHYMAFPYMLRLMSLQKFSEIAVASLQYIFKRSFANADEDMDAKIKSHPQYAKGTTETAEKDEKSWLRFWSEELTFAVTSCNEKNVERLLGYRFYTEINEEQFQSVMKGIMNKINEEIRSHDVTVYKAFKANYFKALQKLVEGPKSINLENVSLMNELARRYKKRDSAARDLAIAIKVRYPATAEPGVVVAGAAGGCGAAAST